MSKSSTSTCVLSLIRAGKWDAGPWRNKATETLRIFLTEKWQSADLKLNNPFTVAFVLEAAAALMQFVPTPISAQLLRRIKRAEDLLKAEIDAGSVSLLGYPPSAYLTQLVTRVLATRNAIKEGTRSKLLEWSWRELDHQLPLLHANSKNADVFQLAYCIILVSDVGDPGEATPEQSLILSTALDLFLKGNYPMDRGRGVDHCFTTRELEAPIVTSMSCLYKCCKARACKADYLNTCQGFGKRHCTLMKPHTPCRTAVLLGRQGIIHN